MAKAPAFQFYTGDWMKDPCVRALCAEGRGLWIDMLCLMWDSPKKGYLCAPNGNAFSNAHVTRMTGVPEGRVIELLHEMEEVGVFSKGDTGVIFCRRMVRDEENRSKTRERVKKHRSSNADVTGDVTHLQHASSSSSSSSTSVNKPLTPQEGNGGQKKRSKITSTEVMFELVEANLDNLPMSGEFTGQFRKWVEHRMGFKKPACGWVNFFSEQLGELSGMTPETALSTVKSSRINGYQGLITPNGSRSATQKPVSESSRVFTAQTKLKAVESELDAIDRRTSKAAMGYLYTPEDKKQKRELAAKLSELKKELIA